MISLFLFLNRFQICHGWDNRLLWYEWYYRRIRKRNEWFDWFWWIRRPNKRDMGMRRDIAQWSPRRGSRQRRLLGKDLIPVSVQRHERSNESFLLCIALAINEYPNPPRHLLSKVLYTYKRQLSSIDLQNNSAFLDSKPWMWYADFINFPYW